jgi:hypothetical protein
MPDIKMHRLVSTLRRLASVERRKYEKAIENGAGSEYVGTCKGLWIAYSDSAKRLEAKINV